VELPRLQTLWETYKDQGLEIVAIESNRETEQAKKFIEKKGLTMTFVENGEGDGEVVRGQYEVSGFPTTFVIDREGRLVFYHLGFDEGDEKKMEEEILKLL
jgi:peroxiredoxin